MLIGSFDINVSWPMQRRMPAQNGLMAHTGVNPDIQSVIASRKRFWQTEFLCEFSVSEFIPDIRASLLDQIGHFADPAWIQNRLAGIVKDWQRHTPTALPRNTPVRTGFNGRVNPVSAPVRDPIGSVNRLKSGRFQEVNPDKELFDRAKNHRCFGPPANRISVMIIVRREQTPNLGEPLDYVFVGIKDIFSDPFRNSNFLGIAPVIVHGRK